MNRTVLAILAIALLVAVTFVAAEAVPTCVPDFLDTYMALGAAGCNFGQVNFSNFSRYEGRSPTGAGIPPEQVHVDPFPAVNLFGGSGLGFSGGDGVFGWGGFDLAFDAQAINGSLIAASLEVFAFFTAPCQEAFIEGTINGGPGLFVTEGTTCFGQVVLPFQSRHSLTFPHPLDKVHFDLFGASEGRGIPFFTVEVVTPEPATFLLWGTGAAGLGAVRWWKRRRSSDHKHAA
jgi:hypothetical protein